MLEAPEPSGLSGSSARWDPEDPEAKAQTKSWDSGGGREREEWDPCIGYQRPLGRAAPPPKKADPGSRYPPAVGDHEPQGPGEVGALVLTLLWFHSRKALQQKFDIRKLVASSPPPCKTVIISSHRHRH